MAVVSGLIWLGLDASRPIDAALETCAARKEIM
jgi:hypothetical protein